MVQSLEGKNDVIIMSLSETVGVRILGGWDMVPCVPDLVQKSQEHCRQKLDEVAEVSK